ncbi:MAG: DUF4440 domain-containing protein [Bacteroidia bacterium]|nr:DUF4440 domain-containing protein [Bacteroidia bacterium]
MTKTIFICLYFICILCSCNTTPDPAQIDKWKQEIVNAEHAFAKLVSEEGIHKGFTTFAADDAVLMRNNQFIAGKSAIDTLYNGTNATNLQWAPDFVDVSASGDLGYTYGSFTVTSVDSTGNTIENRGVFHTVWQRQADGTWKYVWD